MTMFVNLNIVSATASHHATTGRPFSPSMPSAIAKKMLKTTICSTSPSAIASITDSGTTCSRIWSQVCGLAVISDCWPIGRSTPTPGLHDVDRDQADDQRDRRDDLEVDDRAQAHPADDLDVARAGDAGDQRREDQRRDDHLDHPQEQLAERTEVDGRGGVVLADDPADDDAEREADEDLLRQRRSAARRAVLSVWSMRGVLEALGPLRSAPAGSGRT